MDREKVIKGLEHCKEGNTCYGCPYDIDSSKCIFTLHDDAIALLKEQEELLRKLQKDKDKLCNEVSEWKHKYHDRPLKEQEAVKPEWKGGVPFCGNCGHRLQKKNRNMVGINCPMCKRSVKWE